MGLGVAGVAARRALVRVHAGGQPGHRVVVAGVAGGAGAVVPPRPGNTLLKLRSFHNHNNGEGSYKGLFLVESAVC